MNQLKTEYKRDLKTNYMLISFDNINEEELEKYEFKMLENNYISGLMKFKLSKDKEKSILYYDITSKQSLSRILEYKQIGLEDIRKIVFGIIRVISNMERFMLGSDGLLLHIDYIYADPESLDLSLCYLPCMEDIEKSKLSDLFSQILSRLNQDDHEGVVFAYSLYQESLKDNCVLDDLVSIMNKHNKNLKKEGIKKESVNKEAVLKEADASLDKEYIYSSDKTDFIENKKSDKTESFSIKSLFGIKKEKSEKIKEAQEVPKLAKRKKEEFEKGEDEEKEEWLEMFSETNALEREEAHEDKNYTHTVLLVEQNNEKAEYILKSADKSTEDIKLSYFPFIIGKQERICDYIIKSDMVSRLHLRIDKEGKEKFSIRDLNSLNGTRLNGKLLENEEIVELKLGNEVDIANLSFVFLENKVN